MRQVHQDRRSLLSLFVLLAASLVLLPGSAGPAGAEPIALEPVGDATVIEAKPGSKFGTSGTLHSDRSPRQEAYLRFAVPALAGPVSRVTLRLYVTDSTKKAPDVHTTSPEWDETSLTWSNRPAPGGVVAELGSLKSRSWAEYDVTPAVNGEGPLALVLVPRSSDGADFSSGQARSDKRPRLMIESAEPSPTTSTEETTSSTLAGETTTSSTPDETTTSTETTTTTTSETTTSTETSTSTSSSTTTTTFTPVTVPPHHSSCSSRWGTVEDVGDLSAGLTEVSGLVASEAHPGWGWMIRDSGNTASLYSLRLDGGEVAVHEFPIPGTRNRDWEEVAYTTGPGGRGVLWILDNMGNEWTANRRIYQVEEPDPAQPGPATLLGIYEFAYPDVQRNTEILFAFDGDLVLIAKSSPRMYRFTGPLSAETVNVPVYVGMLADAAAPTLGGISPDRRFLIVASYAHVWIFENRGALSDLASLIAHPPERRSVVRDDREGGAFFPTGSCDFVMTAESGNVWKLANG